MSNATRWYCTLESVKAAIPILGSELDALLGSYIESASEDIEKMLEPRRFIPETGIKYYPWPQEWPQAVSYERQGWQVLYVKHDLLAVTLLRTQAQDASPTTIASTDYYLEPVNEGPPYRYDRDGRIEIERSSDALFEAGDESPQRSIEVTGRWGFSEDTKAAGALASAITDAAAVSLAVTDASLIGVGDTLKIDSEALFVSGRAPLDTTADLNDTLTAVVSDVTVTVTDGTKVKQGEVILIESEKMFVESISGNNLTVQRAYDKSVLAAHSGALDVYAYRTLTVVRGVNGTTAATHLTAAAIVKYAPPADIVDYCRARAIAHHQQGRSGWTGQVGGGEGSVRINMSDLESLGKRIWVKYGPGIALA